MRTLTRYYENTTVTAAFATLSVHIESILEIPVVKALIDHGFHAPLIEKRGMGDFDFGATAALSVMGKKGEEPIVKIEGYNAELKEACGFYVHLDAKGDLQAFEFNALPKEPPVRTVRAVIVIEDLRYRAVQATASAPLVEEKELLEEDNSVATWIPSIDMLVRIKKGYTYHGRHEVYILKDIDIYEEAFILVNADSARRERDAQCKVQRVGLNRTRVFDQEVNLNPHGKECIKVPFDAVEPFQLNL